MTNVINIRQIILENGKAEKASLKKKKAKKTKAGRADNEKV